MNNNKSVLKEAIGTILKYSPLSPRSLYLFARRYPPILYIVNKIIMMMIPEKLELQDGIIYLNKKDAVISGALMFGVYENNEINSWRNKIKDSSVVLDIGGNIGIYTLTASAKAKRGKVICFEPEQDNISLLKKSIKENNMTNITLVEKCVGDVSGSAVLGISKYNKGKHSLLQSEIGENIQNVQITTIDEEVEKLGLERVDYIKIDVEGWEAKVLKGMEKTINQFHPEILFEFAPQRIKESGMDPVEFIVDIRNKGYVFYNAEISDNKEYSIEQVKKLSDEKFIDTFVNLWAVYKN
jgi:FkbM family methyltransferase